MVVQGQAERGAYDGLLAIGDVILRVGVLDIGCFSDSQELDGYTRSLVDICLTVLRAVSADDHCKELRPTYVPGIWHGGL